MTTVGVSTLVAVHILDPIALPDDASEPLRFRIEVLRSGSRFTCRLLVEETFRLEPRFQPQTERGVFEFDAIVLETGLEHLWTQIEGQTADDVVESVFRLIEERFEVVIERAEGPSKAGA